MPYKYTSFQLIARTMLAIFLSNIFAPTIQFVFADSTQYYVDAVNGNDSNDGSISSPWQTIAHVNTQNFLQGDTISFACTDTWNETLSLSENGSVGMPITVNSYGTGCVTSATIDGISIANSSYITIDNIQVSTGVVSSIFDISNSDAITVQNSTLSNGSGLCLSASNTTNLNLSSNIFNSCDYGIHLDSTQGQITGNLFMGISHDALTIPSTQVIDVSGNTFQNIGESAIIYGGATQVQNNRIDTACTTSASECAGIKNHSNFSGQTVTAVISSNIMKTIGSGITDRDNFGISTKSVSGATITHNGIVDAGTALNITDAANTTMTGNTLFLSRIHTLFVEQNTPGFVHGNIFNNNNLLQKNPDYPTIEIKDNIEGTGVVSGLLTASSNNFFPIYKPDTSLIRTVQFGGLTQEYGKTQITSFDTLATKFEYFGNKAYTSTGSFATANLLTNPSFSSDTSGWTATAQSGSAPSLSHNATGSYTGGSMTVTAAGGSAEKLWVTNSAILSVSTGQIYQISGYAKNPSGNTSISVRLHQSGDPMNVYGDRVMETYASSSGNTFTQYVKINTSANDAVLSIESDNVNVSYEIDEVSLRQVTGLSKNNTANEVLTFFNSTSNSVSQACPGGVPCFAYVDGINVATNWPMNLPAHSVSFVFWNNSPYVLNAPTCSINLSSGSLPTGQPLTVDWSTTNSTSQNLSYQTYTGSSSSSVATTGSVTFIPSYDSISTITLDTMNDVGPKQCSAQVTTTNTAPTIYVSTITGSEDATEITATLSGIDLNPGDTVFFEKFSDPTNGSIVVDTDGTIHFIPNADFCGVENSFMFRAADQWGHYADPISQPITVACVNDAPVAVDDSVTNSGGTSTYDVSANDTDKDSIYTTQTLSIYAFTQPANGTVTQNGNNLDFFPVGGFSGVTTFQYSISDQSGAISNTGTVSVNVTLPNTAPNAYDISLSTNEDTPIMGVLSGTDIDGNTLSFTAVTLPSHGTVSIQNNGSYSYTPDANFSGVDSLTYKANDGSLYSNTATVTINIFPVNDAPIATNDSYTLNQDMTFFVPVMNNDSDVDSTGIFLSGYTIPTHGNVLVAGTGFYYTPSLGYTGSDSFTYNIEDTSSLLSNTATVTLNVTQTNFAPVASGGTLSMNEDTILTDIMPGYDPEASTLTYIVTSLPTQGTLNWSSTGAFTYTPNANFAGSDSFNYYVSDGIYNSTNGIMSITVNGVNDAPTAISGSYTAIGNTNASSGNITIGNLSGTDPENSPLTFSASVLPTHGTLILSQSGLFSYTPALGYTGSDSFSFTVSDGIASSVVAQVYLTVISNGVVPAINHFNISAPSSVTRGQPFSLSLTAIDVYNFPISGYTGVVNITSSDSGATLTTPVVFYQSDNGTKNITITLSRAGSVNISFIDNTTGTGSSTTVIVNEPVVTPVSTAPITGGGGPSAGAPHTAETTVIGSSESEMTLNAPSNTPTVIASPDGNTLTHTTIGSSYFVLLDPSGLLGQLFLTKRSMSGTGISIVQNEDNHIGMILSPISWNTPITQTQTGGVIHQNRIIDTLSNMTLTEQTGSVILRQIARLYMKQADASDTPVEAYKYGISVLENLDTKNIERISLTRDILIRVYEEKKKSYEYTLYRSAPTKPEHSYSHTGEDPSTGGGSDPSGTGNNTTPGTVSSTSNTILPNNFDQMTDEEIMNYINSL